MSGTATRVTIHQAKTNLSKLIAEVERGGDVIIMRRNKPVARLGAATDQRPQRRPGRLKGLIEIGPEFFEPLPDADLRLWNGEGE
jgi:prevent-host-death family protein